MIQVLENGVRVTLMNVLEISAIISGLFVRMHMAPITVPVHRTCTEETPFQDNMYCLHRILDWLKA